MDNHGNELTMCSFAAIFPSRLVCSGQTVPWPLWESLAGYLSHGLFISHPLCFGTIYNTRGQASCRRGYAVKFLVTLLVVLIFFFLWILWWSMSSTTWWKLQFLMELTRPFSYCRYPICSHSNGSFPNWHICFPPSNPWAGLPNLFFIMVLSQFHGWFCFHFPGAPRAFVSSSFVATTGFPMFSWLVPSILPFCFSFCGILTCLLQCTPLHDLCGPLCFKFFFLPSSW